MVPHIHPQSRVGFAAAHANSNPSPFIKATKTVGLIALGCLAIYALSLKYLVLISAACIGSYGIYAGAHTFFGENKILGPEVTSRVANRMFPQRPNLTYSRHLQSPANSGRQAPRRNNPRISNQRPPKPNNPRGDGQSCQVHIRPNLPHSARGGKPCTRSTGPKIVSFRKGTAIRTFDTNSPIKIKGSFHIREGKTIREAVEGKG